MFFANINCPKPTPVVKVDPVVVCNINSNIGTITPSLAGTKDTKGDTLSLYTNTQFGYDATIQLKACVPFAEFSSFNSGAVIQKYSQSCYIAGTGTKSTAPHKLKRSSGPSVLFTDVVAQLFEVNDCTDAIDTITTDNAACTAKSTTTTVKSVSTTSWAISCATDKGGITGPVTVTLNQKNKNAAITTSFAASLAAPSPVTPAKKSSNTTAIVLGVLGGVVGIGLVAGVVWYVIKGRQGGVDPYGEDATQGLTNQEHA